MAFRNRIICYVCNHGRAPQLTSRLDGEENALAREIAVNRRDDIGRPPLAITPETRVCNNCMATIRREIEILQNDPQCMRLNVLTQASSITCLVCNGLNDIHRLSLECRVDVFVKRNIYIPVKNVCCKHHLNDQGFLIPGFMEGLRYINRPYVLKGPELQSFLEALRLEVDRAVHRRFEDESSLTDTEFEILYPLSKANFIDLLTYCDPILVPGGYRYVSKKDLLCFLCKLRQGLSDELLKVIFQYSSRQVVSMAIATVRQSLMIRFAPENIGFEAITREDYIERHVTPFANHLYNPTPHEPKAITYIDCTYLNIEKSSCFKALRQSYSVYKGKHLVKPSMITASDGYILDIQGPYFSNAANNDAKILLNEFNRDVNGMRNWFRQQDICVLDRGYRDAIRTLERIGLKTIMPPFLQANQTQFSTEEANEARLVTKTRWVVEARNGHLKNIFKFFNNMISTSHIPNLSDLLRIAGAIINKYHGVIAMLNTDENLADRMLIKAREVNIVQARVEAENLRRKRARWVQLTNAHVPLFPVLTIDYLRDLTYGTYQVYLAPSYIQDSSLRIDQDEEEDEERTFELDQNTNEPGFMRIRVLSRFRSATVHQLWIAFNEEYVNDPADPENPDDPILGYYCTCKAGARTLGTCAHVASTLWYLGYARHENNVRYPSLRVLRSVLDARMNGENPDIEILDPFVENA